MARKKPGTAGAAAPAQPRNSQLRARFPPRPAQPWWPGTAPGEAETLRRLTSPPFLPEVKATRAGRRRGTAKLLRWLSSFPGDTWQQRWDASGAEDRPGSSWLELPLGWLRDDGLAASYDANDLSSGLLMLLCGDVIRPGLAEVGDQGPQAPGPRHGGGARSRWVRQAARAGGIRAAGVPEGRAARGHQDRDPAGLQGRPPSATAWRRPTPSGWSTPAAARRKSTSICGCTPSGSFPLTPRPPSARSAWPRAS